MVFICNWYHGNNALIQSDLIWKFFFKYCQCFFFPWKNLHILLSICYIDIYSYTLYNISIYNQKHLLCVSAGVYIVRVNSDGTTALIRFIAYLQLAAK